MQDPPERGDFIKMINFNIFIMSNKNIINRFHNIFNKSELNLLCYPGDKLIINSINYIVLEISIYDSYSEYKFVGNISLFSNDKSYYYLSNDYNNTFNKDIIKIEHHCISDISDVLIEYHNNERKLKISY